MFARAVLHQPGTRAAGPQVLLPFGGAVGQVGRIAELRLLEPVQAEDAACPGDVLRGTRMAGGGEREQFGRKVEPGPQHRRQLQGFECGARVEGGRGVTRVDEEVPGLIDDGEGAEVQAFDEASARDLDERDVCGGVAGLGVLGRNGQGG